MKGWVSDKVGSWQGGLFLNVGLVTAAKRAGEWGGREELVGSSLSIGSNPVHSFESDTPSSSVFILNLLRVLSSSRSNLHAPAYRSPKLLGFWNKRVPVGAANVPILSREKGRDKADDEREREREVNVCITDLCEGDGVMDPHAQAQIILLDYDGESRSLTHAHSLAIETLGNCLQNRIPVYLIVSLTQQQQQMSSTLAWTSSQLVQFSPVKLDHSGVAANGWTEDCIKHLLAILSGKLSVSVTDLLKGCVVGVGALILSNSVLKLDSTSNFSFHSIPFQHRKRKSSLDGKEEEAEGEWESECLRECISCISHALQVVSSFAQPMPLLQRVRLGEWVEECVCDCLDEFTSITTSSRGLALSEGGGSSIEESCSQMINRVNECIKSCASIISTAHSEAEAAGTSQRIPPLFSIASYSTPPSTVSTTASPNVMIRGGLFSEWVGGKDASQHLFDSKELSNNLLPYPWHSPSISHSITQSLIQAFQLPAWGDCSPPLSCKVGNCVCGGGSCSRKRAMKWVSDVVTATEERGSNDKEASGIQFISSLGLRLQDLICQSPLHEDGVAGTGWQRSLRCIIENYMRAQSLRLSHIHPFVILPHGLASDVRGKWASAASAAVEVAATRTIGAEGGKNDTWDDLHEVSWIETGEGGLSDVTRRKRGSQERMEEWDDAVGYSHYHRTLPQSPTQSLTPLPLSIKRHKGDSAFESDITTTRQTLQPTRASTGGSSETQTESGARGAYEKIDSWRSVFDEVGEERERQEQLRGMLTSALSGDNHVNKPIALRESLGRYSMEHSVAAALQSSPHNSHVRVGLMNNFMHEQEVGAHKAHTTLSARALLEACRAEREKFDETFVL